VLTAQTLVNERNSIFAELGGSARWQEDDDTLSQHYSKLEGESRIFVSGATNRITRHESGKTEDFFDCHVGRFGLR
jgi:hypothetical protein